MNLAFNPAEFVYNIEQQLWLDVKAQAPQLDVPTQRPVVLGIAFLKYVSEVFETFQQFLLCQFQQDDSEHVDPMLREDYPDNITYADALQQALQQRHYYKTHRVLWVPETVRWRVLQAKSLCLPASVVSVAALLDLAFWSLDLENPFLRGALDEKYVGYQASDAQLRAHIRGLDRVDFGEFKI